MTELRIAADLTLPLDVVTQAIAILARRGAGKTYTAAVLVEEVAGAGLPVVVLDPTGAWWGLRSSADGTKPGLPVVILGGQHGDVPLEQTAGKVIADVVVDHPGAYVIDLSGFESRASEQRFAADFLERLYRAKATRKDALLVVVDEADLFAPQRPGTEQIRTLGALEAIVRRGRIRGLGVVLISQRAAVLNKNVLTQSEVLIAMQTTGPQDRAAIDDWIKDNGTAEERDTVLKSLAGLERGVAWVWSPSWLRILQQVRIRPRKTFDSSKTPEAGEAAVTPQAFAKVDLDKLGAEISASVEKAKADDPRELRRRIQQLESESAARLAIIERRSEPEVRVERVEVPVLNGQVEQLAKIVGDLREIGQGMVVAGTGLAGVADSITTAIDRASSAPRTAQQVATPVATARGTAGRLGAPTGAAVPRTRGTEPATTRDPAPQAAVGAPLDRPLKAPERAILVALAQYPQGRTQQQVSLLSGYSSTSGSFFGALASLKRDGLIEGTASLFRATGEGIAALGGFWDPLPTGRELIDYWLARLKPPEKAVLGVLIEVWPGTLAQAEVAERSGYSGTSGSFFGALAKLRKLDLIVGGAPALRASDDIAEHA